MAPHAEDGQILSGPDAYKPDISAVDNTQSIPTTPKEAGYRSLPLPNPSLSYWQRTTRAYPHLHANIYASTPTTARIVIIGSGLSGALTAWSLVHNHTTSASDITILEAREAVSGASGRNAGHVRPDAFRGFSAYAKVHGPEQALKILQNERTTFEKVADFVKEFDVPCDFESGSTFDVCLTEQFVSYQRESFEAFKHAGGDVSHVKIWRSKEAVLKTRVPGALEAYEWPAGSSHPAKLAQWLLSRLIELGVGLWTHCPAMEVKEHVTGEGADKARWDIVTPRGTIAAETVIHCTNAYAAHLLPEVASVITPNRAQAHAFVPGYSLSGANAQKSTMSLRYGLRHFFSFIQRSSDGMVVYGVSRENPNWSEETKRSVVTFDDSTYNEEIAASAEHAFQALFASGDSNPARHGEGGSPEQYWSGIIAMTPDSVPMVGALEGKDGQFILAGHNGHGMARIWSCAPGLAKLIAGELWSATELPECFQYSKARLERASRKHVKSVW